GKGGIHAAGDDGVEHTAADVAEGVAHGVGGGRAAVGDDVAQAAETEPHRHFAGERADGPRGNRVHAALFQMAGVKEAVLLFGEILAAAAGADHDTDAAQFVARHVGWVQTGVFHRFRHAGHRQRHGARDVGTVLHVHVLLLVKLLRHLPCDLHLKWRWVETRNAPHSTDAIAAGLPKGLTTDSIWAHRANPRYRHATHFYVLAFPRLLSIGRNG